MYSSTVVANDRITSSAPATISVDIAPVNDRPLAGDAEFGARAGDPPLQIDLSPVVSDVETTAASSAYTIVDEPTKGALSGSGPTFTYTPDEGATGDDTFTYTVTDRGDPDNCGEEGP